MKKLMNRFLGWMIRCFGNECPKCAVGRVYYDHEEPHKHTWVNIYKCDNCETEFI